MKTRQIALIPAYEPTQMLCNLLEQAKQAGFELIVVESKRLRACKNTKKPEVLPTPLVFCIQKYVVRTATADP